MFQDMIRDPKFWWAVYGLLLAILTYFVPSLPKEIMAAVELLITVILSFLTVKTVRAKAQLRALKGPH